MSTHGAGDASRAVQFLIEEVFDLPSRGGLLVSGKVLAGRISAGERLQDAVTGATATVLALEFPTPASRAANTITLVVERTDPTSVVVGRILTT
jgi:hypothetical protein